MADETDADEMAAADAAILEFIASIERTQAILRRMLGDVERRDRYYSRLASRQRH